jgi:hypothetical protein
MGRGIVGIVAVVRTRAGTWLRTAPWIFILTAIAVVQLVRDQPVDATIFGVGAVALVLDAAGAVRPGPERPSVPLTVLITAAAVVTAALTLAPRSAGRGWRSRCA